MVFFHPFPTALQFLIPIDSWVQALQCNLHYVRLTLSRTPNLTVHPSNPTERVSHSWGKC